MNWWESSTAGAVFSRPAPLPKYPPNLKWHWKLRFRLDDARFVLTHLHEYRVVHKDRICD